MKVWILLVAILSTTAFALPDPVGYVNDFANILPDKGFIESELRAYEENTSIEIVVVTLETLPEDQTLFSYGVELFDEWNIGKSDDNGILVLLVKNGTTGNRMRIELGYGIQGYITGSEAGQILDEAMPYYKQSDYQGAVATILVGLSRELEGYIPGKSNINRMPFDIPIDTDLLILVLSNFPVFIFIFMLFISILMRNRCPYCIRGHLVAKGDHYVCNRCGRTVTKRKRYAPIWIGGGYHSGGFGGFGGGSSGGGGAGR